MAVEIVAPSGRDFLVRLGAGLLVLLLIDGAWIWYSTRKKWYPVVEQSRVRALGIIGLYNVMVATLATFVTADGYTEQWAAALGAALWVYGTFNLTSLATNTEWTLFHVGIDLLAGICVYSALFLLPLVLVS